MGRTVAFGVPALDPTMCDASRTRRGILATGGLAHFVCDGFTDCLYVLLPLWAAAFTLTHVEVGVLKMTMSGALALAQIPAGFLAERRGERSVLVAGIVVAGVGFVLLSLAEGFFSLAGILVVAGIGCGAQHPLASSVISRAFASGGRRAALGTYNFTGDLGKVVVPVAIAACAAVFGWRYSTVAYGAIAIAASAVVFALLRWLQAGSRPQSTEESGQSTPAHGWGIVDRRGFGTLAAIGMIDSGARLGFLTFLPFLLLEKGAAIETLGMALGLVFAGGAAGKLVCGLIAERVGILRTVIITEIATAALIAAVIVAPLTAALVVMPFLGIALNGTSSVLYGTVADFVSPHRQARAYGLFYTLGIGAGALSPVALGVVSDRWGVTMALGLLAACIFAILPLCPILRASLAASARSQPGAAGRE